MHPKKEILKYKGYCTSKKEILKDENTVHPKRRNTERCGDLMPKTISLIEKCPKMKINFFNDDLR